jgi:hypothetical protein
MAAPTAKEALKDYKDALKTLSGRPGHAGAIQDAVRALFNFLDAVEATGAPNEDHWLAKAVNATRTHYERTTQDPSKMFTESFGEALASTLPSLEKMLSKLPEKGPKRLKHAGFTILNTGAFHPGHVEAITKVLDRVESSLRRRGFDELLYGDLQLVRGDQLRTTAQHAGAAYRSKTDDLLIDPLALDSDVRDLAFRVTHELGHRLWYRFLNDDQREVWKLSWRDAKDFVSSYAKTSPVEDFAETVATYCISVLTGEPLERFKALKSMLGESISGATKRGGRDLWDDRRADRNARPLRPKPKPVTKEQLEETLKRFRERGRQPLWRGEKSISCPSCEGPMVETDEKGQYVCEDCGYTVKGVDAAFKAPYDGWKAIRKGRLPVPTPLEDSQKLWEKIAKRVDHDVTKGVQQRAPIIGGRRRYHHRPLTSWLLSDGDVLTLTTDEMEAKVWNHLKSKRHPAMPRVYDVFAVRTKGEAKAKLWAILHERLIWPVDKDWDLFVDSLFRWRAMQKNALQPAKVQDLEDFLRFVIDEEAAPKTVKRNRIEHVLPWKMTKDRRHDVKERRDTVFKDPDLEGKIAWAKAALKYLKSNGVRFRDFDPSNLAKTRQGGRTVITNLAESRSKQRKTGRYGSVKATLSEAEVPMAGKRIESARARVASAAALAFAYRSDPRAVLRAFTAPAMLQAEAEAPDAAAALCMSTKKALETLSRISRHLERDIQALQDECGEKPPSPEVAATLKLLAENLERVYKKTAQKLVALR